MEALVSHRTEGLRGADWRRISRAFHTWRRIGAGHAILFGGPSSPCGIILILALVVSAPKALRWVGIILVVALLLNFMPIGGRPRRWY